MVMPHHHICHQASVTMQLSRVSWNVSFKKGLFHCSLFCSCSLIHALTFCYPSVVEGYLRTDDRMRLAKERREERERSLGKKCLFLLVANKVNLCPEGLRKAFGLFPFQEL